MSVVLYAAGEIHTGNRQLGADEQIASNVICKQLQQAKADRSVRAVVLRIDSPGVTCQMCLVSVCHAALLRFVVPTLHPVAFTKEVWASNNALLDDMA